MPLYDFEDPESGLVITVEGPSEPTDADLEPLFRDAYQEKSSQLTSKAQTFGDIENLLTGMAPQNWPQAMSQGLRGAYKLATGSDYTPNPEAMGKAVAQPISKVLGLGPTGRGVVQGLAESGAGLVTGVAEAAPLAIASTFGGPAGIATVASSFINDILLAAKDQFAGYREAKADGDDEEAARLLTGAIASVAIALGAPATAGIASHLKTVRANKAILDTLEQQGVTREVLKSLEPKQAQETMPVRGEPIPEWILARQPLVEEAAAELMGERRIVRPGETIGPFEQLRRERQGVDIVSPPRPGTKIEEVPVAPSRETLGGKVSFAAEAPVLLRTMVDQSAARAASVGLVESAQAAKRAESPPQAIEETPAQRQPGAAVTAAEQVEPGAVAPTTAAGPPSRTPTTEGEVSQVTEPVGGPNAIPIREAETLPLAPPSPHSAEVGAQVRQPAPTAQAQAKTQEVAPAIPGFAQRALPALQARIGELHNLLVDSDAFAASEFYGRTFPIPKTGGIISARQTQRYKTDPVYASNVDAAIQDITDTIVRSNRQRLALMEKPGTGLFGVDYAIEKARAKYGVNVVRAWHNEAKQKYPYTRRLGNVSVREAFQNSMDAVMSALESGQIRKGEIKINTDSYDNKGFSVDDNGIGMSDVDIGNKFLSLHSTGKAVEGRFGGFGIAKAVILGPADSGTWTLLTRDNRFTHELAQANEVVETVPFRQGTKIEVTTDSYILDDDAKRYVESTELPKRISVSFDGEPVANPFARLRPARQSVKINETTSYEMAYYPKAPQGYNHKYIIRLVDDKTGAKLTQAIKEASDDFSGTIVVDITTSALPGSEAYPLVDSRMELKWGAEKPVSELIQKHTVDPLSAKRAGQKSRFVPLNGRTEWQAVIAKIVNDASYKQLSDTIQSIWTETGSFYGASPIRPFTPLPELSIKIDTGFKGYAGGTLFQAKHLAAYEAVSRMLSGPAGAKVSNFYGLLPKVIDGGSVGAEHSAGGAMGLNFLSIDKTSLKSPYAYALYLRDLALHELTHDYYGPHNEEFTAKEIQLKRDTFHVFPYVVRIAEAALGKELPSKIVEKKVPYRVEVPVEKVTVVDRYLPPEQQRFIYDTDEQLPSGKAKDDLYYPRPEPVRQLELEPRPEDRGGIGFGGTPEDAGAGRVTEQPSPPGATLAEPRGMGSGTTPEVGPPSPAAPGPPKTTSEAVPAFTPSPEVAAGAKSKAIPAKDIIDRLESLKLDTGTNVDFLGISESAKRVVNLGIDVAIAAVKAGRAIGEAVNEAIQYIKYNLKSGEFNEPEVRAYIESTVKYHIPEGQKPTVVTPSVQSEKTAIRKFAARGLNAPVIPEEVKQTIGASPESKYTVQSMNLVQDVVGRMSKEELGAVPKESDLYTASKIKLFKDLFSDGKNDAGYQVFRDLETELTRMGQVINQAKLLQSLNPKNVVDVVNRKLVESKYDPLTKDQAGRLTGLAEDRLKATIEFEKLQKEWSENPSDENAAKLIEQEKNVHNASLKEQRMVHKFEHRSISSLLKTILQGNLLTTVSEIANIAGNVNFIIPEAVSRTLASGLNTIDTYVRNVPRVISVSPKEGSKASFRGLIEGIKKVPRIMLDGAGFAVKGESKGLHPLDAWARLLGRTKDFPTRGGKLPVLDKLGAVLEGTIGVSPEVMLRGLASGDVPPRMAARARLIAEQSSLSNLTPKQAQLAQQFPELFFDKKTVARIDDESLAAIFQRKSETVNFVNSFLHKKGNLADLSATFIAPYKLTPWNLIGRILNYNPLIGIGRSIYEGSRGNMRESYMHASRAIVGGIIGTSAVLLYSKGLLAPSMDSRSELQKNRLLANEVLPPNHINLSGLDRYLKGESPAFRKGDKTADVFRVGGLVGSMFYLVSNVMRDLEQKPVSPGLAVDLLKSGILEQVRFGVNQSMMKGIAGTLEAINSGNADAFIQGLANATLSIPLPNTLSQISRVSRRWKPDIKSETFTGIAGNALKNRLGFLGADKLLPLKRGLWGEPLLETPKDSNALLYHFFDITKSHQVTDDAVALELYRLWRSTGDNGVVPAIPSDTIRLRNQDWILNRNQYSTFIELVGSIRREIADNLVINPNYQRLPEGEKIRVLKKAYDKGMDDGKELFLRDYADELELKQKRRGFAFPQ